MSKKNGKIDFEGLGIEIIKTPEQQAHAGLFEPPPNFPKDKLSIEWVPEDQVRYKEQKQVMVGVGALAPGLTVWKGADGKSKPEVRFASGNKKFVLMVRPKAVTMAMNALYGNVSKRYYNSEVRGETIAGGDLQDPGMLSESRLKEEVGAGIDVEESLMALNEVGAKSPQEAAEVSV